MVDSFAEITGDNNPIHMDEKYASKTPFKKCIAHGILSAGFISSVLAKHMPGPGTVYLSQTLQFLSPVFIGDELEVSVRVKHIREDKPIANLETTCMVGSTIVVLGEAFVKYLK